MTSPFSNCCCLCLGEVTAADPTTGCTTASLRLTTEEEEPRRELLLLASRLFLRSVSTSTLWESVTWERYNQPRRNVMISGTCHAELLRRDPLSAMSAQL